MTDLTIGHRNLLKFSDTDVAAVIKIKKVTKMTIPVKFEMEILEIFHLQNGQTVFVGLIKNYEGLIKKCQVELLLDGQLDKIVEIVGEMIPDKKHPQGYRAVATKASIDWTNQIVRKHECKLRTV